MFHFKQFSVKQEDSAMKIGTDAMIFGAVISVEDKTKALDIGTGTGVLSLMLAQRNENLSILSLELDKRASQEAKVNFENSPFKNQLEVLFCDFLEFQTTEKFDLIFSNPPFFENSMKSEGKSNSEQKNLARHTDSLPLGNLITHAEAILSQSGDFWIILPPIAADSLLEETSKLKLFLNLEMKVYGKPNQLTRKIICFSKTKKEFKDLKLIVRDEKGNYTPSYKKLTIEYHNRKL